MHRPNLSRFTDHQHCEDIDSILSDWDSEKDLLDTMQNISGASGFLHFISKHSPYLTLLLSQHPDIYATFLQGEIDSCLETIITEIYSKQIDNMSLKEGQQYLREQKQKVSLLTALANLSDYWLLEDVTHSLSKLADATTQFALEQSYRHHIPKQYIAATDAISASRGITILGLGKLGGKELNYSSDIDIIALFDPEKLDFLNAPARTRFAVRLIQQVSSYLQDFTEQGYVFRVDLRLRPDPASTGLAVSLDSALSYYERVGQNWERAAMIKARYIAGDRKTANIFLASIQRFIWRTHLDFAAIDDILSIKRQMQSRQDTHISLNGHHLKTGYGGIRSIEFLAQIHQLIWGGRIPALRLQASCDVLNTLTDHHLISRHTNHKLQHAYRLFRHVEHHLQMQRDQQTHTLPESEEELITLAAFCGFDHYQEFHDKLLSALETTRTIFTNAFNKSVPLGHGGNLVFTGVEHDEDTLITLKNMGFDCPEDISSTIQSWHKGTKRCTRTKRARELLTELVPDILGELSNTAYPDLAFKRFDAFLDSLPVGVQPFSMFKVNRNLLTLITEISGSAPILAKRLSLYPSLLDQLVEHYKQPLVTTPGSIRTNLQGWLDTARDHEEQINKLCTFKLEQEFITGIKLLTRDISARAASDYLTRLANNMIRTVIELTTAQLNAKYNVRPDIQIAVIGLGKLGTQELMIGSDLDVMFIYDIPVDSNISEAHALNLTQYYNRMAVRTLHTLAHPTKAGPLYEMDTKLRPYGSQGAVAVRLDGFSNYYASSSWLVENLALLQGRVIYASEGFDERVDDALITAKKLQSSPLDIGKNIIETRGKIIQQHNADNIWDIKYAHGGMMDLQWILKCQIGKFSTRHTIPNTLHHTSDQINWLANIGALDEYQRQTLLEAHNLFHTTLSYLRLCHGDKMHERQINEGLKRLLTDVTSMRTFALLEQHIIKLQRQVHVMFQNLTYM